MSGFQAPKGVPDYLPPESAEFVAVRDGLLAVARRATLPTEAEIEAVARGTRP